MEGIASALLRDFHLPARSLVCLFVRLFGLWHDSLTRVLDLTTGRGWGSPGRKSAACPFLPTRQPRLCFVLAERVSLGLQAFVRRSELALGLLGGRSNGNECLH
jgi:hypothetical protein